jgi:4-hydroxy-tetrahydrodipicolinate synthase
MKEVKIQGVAETPIVVWDSKGGIDRDKTKRLIPYLIDAGISTLFCGGTMGETGLMTIEQRKELTDIGIEATKGKMILLADPSHNCTRVAVELSKYAENAGADGVMVSLPHNPKPAQEGLYQHYKIIAEGINIPVFIYSYPAQFGIHIEPETIARLAKDGYIHGIKYSSLDVPSMAEIIRLTEGKINVMAGSEPSILTALCLGCDVIMGICTSLVPEEFVKVYKLFKTGKVEEAGKQMLALFGLFNVLTARGTKLDMQLVREGLKMLGHDVGDSPMPLSTKVSQLEKEQLRQELKKLGKLE